MAASRVIRWGRVSWITSASPCCYLITDEAPTTQQEEAVLAGTGQRGGSRSPAPPLRMPATAALRRLRQER
jgi:hypothetical protein